MLEFVGKTKDGREVWDRPNSHRHIQKELVGEALEKINTQNLGFLVEEVEMGRIIGTNFLVPTTVDDGGDAIVYARRPGRKGLTRFVKGMEGVLCSSIVVILKRCEEGFYLLITAYVGKKSFPEPWDKNATPEALEFWATHALVWGSEEMKNA